MQGSLRSAFHSIRSEGALLPADILIRIQHFDKDLEGVTAEAYHREGEQLNEVISESWLRLQRFWKAFQNAREQLPANDSGTSITRERWLLHLFSELGYGRLYSAKAVEVEGKSYPVSHEWLHTPIHMVSYKVKQLDQQQRQMVSSYRGSPYSLVQELLNRSPERLWGIVTNGLQLRLLRKNVSLTRQAYLEFDLETMMQGENYADFTLFWLLCHQSRLEAERVEDCWQEKWARLAQAQGIRVLDKLRDGVVEAIEALGAGLLVHPANYRLRAKLSEKTLEAQEYYRQVLRLVYRLIILFVAEDRDVLLRPGDTEQTLKARERYNKYYSTQRLRLLAEQRIGTRHSDLFRGLWLVMEMLGNDKGCEPLGLYALNGFLFSRGALPDLADCELANHYVLQAVRSLAFTSEERVRRVVDYKNLGPEELGSVYESLLELHPEITTGSVSFKLQAAGGNERKTSGSYYTPTSLIDCLLDSALEPVLAAACARPEPEKAILNLKVCDPACGSGHFLIAAAHRIARKLAAVRSGSEEPGANERRAALRDVVGHCIYGVDINPMAVELCKVNLWMEAIVPGKPFSFLDAHIQCGNSLLGATPALLKQGIPDGAFEAIEGDDRKICSEFKKRNKQLRAGQLSLIREDKQSTPLDHQGNLFVTIAQFSEMGEENVTEVRQKQQFYEEFVKSDTYKNALLWANAWCAAFVWKKTTEMRPPITDEEFRDIGRNPFTLASWRKAEIERLAEQYQFFHWHLAFPDVFSVPEQAENEQAGWSGGFDVVLGNPPWERIKIQEKEWFATRRPEITNAANASLRRKMIAALAGEDPNLHAAFMEDLRKAAGESCLVRDTERYPLCGRGDVNTYSIFAEDMRSIINRTGRVGCIVPSGIATDDTLKYFFQNLIEIYALISLYSFENREKLFPTVDSRYSFCLLTLTGAAKPATEGADFAFFVQNVSHLQDEQRHFTLNANDIKLLNPNTRTCPIFRSKRDMRLTKTIYERVPVLIKEGPPEENPWGIKFFRMFDMANDSHLFRTRELLEGDGWKLKGNIFEKDGEQCLPLYEGKMIWHFDHRFSEYESTLQAFKDLDAEQHKNSRMFPLPRYWVHASHLPEAVQNKTNAIPVFRDITNSTNARTALFSIIPIVPCGHTLPVIINESNSYELINLSSCCSSFAFDYVARQKLGGTHMTFFILKQLPVLSPESYTKACQWDASGSIGNWILPRALELTYTAWDLEAFAQDCGYAGPPFRWDEERRFLLRCELDAAYFHLYSIGRDDVDYIMDTFRVWKEKEEKEQGEYRTKRVIMEIYDEMQRAINTGQPYQTRLEPPPADPAVAHLPCEDVEG